jgi:hypothetical protein
MAAGAAPLAPAAPSVAPSAGPDAAALRAKAEELLGGLVSFPVK